MSNSKKGKSSWNWHELAKIIFIALITCILSVGGTLYLASHLKPELLVKYAWARAFTMPQEGKKHSYISGMVDLCSSQLITGSLCTITFNSEKDYSFDPNVQSYVGKIIVTNKGYLSAKTIRLGIAFMFPTKSLDIINSPNVETSLQPTESRSDLYPTHKTIEIDRLPPRESAFFTLIWTHEGPLTNLWGDTLRQDQYYIPEILFISSEEVLGTIEGYITLAQARELEAESISSSPMGFWDSALYVEKEGAQITIKQIDPSSVEAEIFIERKSINPSSPPIRN